jgi:hypothetical protein
MKRDLFRFTIPILEANVLVTFAPIHQDASKILGKYLKGDVDCSGAVAIADSDSNKIGVWIGPKSKSKTVVHECHHVMKFAYEFAGCKLGADEEMDACFMEFISGKVLDGWDKYKKKDIDGVQDSRIANKDAEDRL